MKLSNRDWVQLSSYLDGEMNLRELNKMKERIQKEPALQLALEELRQTKNTLQLTPKLRVPHNFTLTPAMVGLRTSSRQVRGYRLVSALMTFLLIGVVVLDFGRSFVSGSLGPAAPNEVMLEAISEPAADALEEPALMEAEGAVESEKAGADTEAEAPLVEEAPAPQEAAEVMEEGESLGTVQEAESRSTEDEAIDAATNQTDAQQEDNIAEEQVLPSQTLAPEIAGTDVPQTPPTAYVREEDPQRIGMVPAIDPFRTLEIILAFSAVSFAIAAWLKKRKNY